MKASLAQGVTATKRIDIDLARTIGFMGEEGRVYSTPMMIGDIEMTCRNLILEHLDPGEDSVGMRIETDHLAPTPLGAWVEVTATIAEVKGRAVVLDFSVRDGAEEVGRGRHRRYVVDVAQTQQRVLAKAAKLKGP